MAEQKDPGKIINYNGKDYDFYKIREAVYRNYDNYARQFGYSQSKYDKDRWALEEIFNELLTNNGRIEPNQIIFNSDWGFQKGAFGKARNKSKHYRNPTWMIIDTIQNLDTPTSSNSNQQKKITESFLKQELQSRLSGTKNLKGGNNRLEMQKEIVNDIINKYLNGTLPEGYIVDPEFDLPAYRLKLNKLLESLNSEPWEDDELSYYRLGLSNYNEPQETQATTSDDRSLAAFIASFRSRGLTPDSYPDDVLRRLYYKEVVPKMYDEVLQQWGITPSTKTSSTKTSSKSSEGSKPTSTSQQSNPSSDKETKAIVSSSITDSSDKKATDNTSAKDEKTDNNSKETDTSNKETDTSNKETTNQAVSLRDFALSKGVKPGQFFNFRGTSYKLTKTGVVKAAGSISSATKIGKNGMKLQHIKNIKKYQDPDSPLENDTVTYKGEDGQIHTVIIDKETENPERSAFRTAGDIATTLTTFVPWTNKYGRIASFVVPNGLYGVGTIQDYRNGLITEKQAWLQGLGRPAIQGVGQVLLGRGRIPGRLAKPYNEANQKFTKTFNSNRNIQSAQKAAQEAEALKTKAEQLRTKNNYDALKQKKDADLTDPERQAIADVERADAEYKAFLESNKKNLTFDDRKAAEKERLDEMKKAAEDPTKRVYGDFLYPGVIGGAQLGTEALFSDMGLDTYGFSDYMHMFGLPALSTLPRGYSLLRKAPKLNEVGEYEAAVKPWYSRAWNGTKKWLKEGEEDAITLARRSRGNPSNDDEPMILSTLIGGGLTGAGLAYSANSQAQEIPPMHIPFYMYDQNGNIDYDSEEFQNLYNSYLENPYSYGEYANDGGVSEAFGYVGRPVNLHGSGDWNLTGPAQPAIQRGWMKDSSGAYIPAVEDENGQIHGLSPMLDPVLSTTNMSGWLKKLGGYSSEPDESGRSYIVLPNQAYEYIKKYPDLEEAIKNTKNVIFSNDNGYNVFFGPDGLTRKYVGEITPGHNKTAINRWLDGWKPIINGYEYNGEIRHEMPVGSHSIYPLIPPAAVLGGPVLSVLSNPYLWGAGMALDLLTSGKPEDKQQYQAPNIDELRSEYLGGN